MNAEQLLAHYERIAEAPDAIARLRQFVLDLAVRGKLVEQIASDEPASTLLTRIAAEKARLTKAKKIKKSEVDPITADESAYELPPSWQWARLGEIGDWGAGSTPSRSNADLYDGGITWLKSGELNDNTQLAGSDETVTELAVEKGSFRINQPGDVLIAMYGATIGKLAILAEVAVTNQAVCGCTPFDGISNRFLFLFLLSQREAFHSASEGGAQPNISKVKIVWSPIAVPPLAEQHRIVAKVDELMALCDRLEEARKEREAARDRLTAASLARLNAPDPDPATFTAHARFALDNLPALTTRADQIKQLRQTILNLAVRGRLVEQSADDTAASEMLSSISEEKVRLAKTGKIRKPKPLPRLTEAETYFSPPEGWTWCHLGDLVLDSDSGWSPQTEGHAREGNAWGVLKVSAVSWDKFDPLANKQVLPGTEPRLQAQVHRGDFLISRANTAELVARAVLVKEEPLNLMMSDKIVRLHLSEHCDHDFALLANNNADFAREYYASSATGASPSMKNVSRSTILELPLALPPLAEQRRIVAKVNELMALCDRLEASLVTGNETRQRLLEVILHEALEPAEARELEPA